MALVIGNAGYANATALNNPLNDADDMGAALESLGFRVFVGKDTRRGEMVGLIDAFGKAAAESDVALFFFAGHAFQVDGRNYLTPTDLVVTGAQEALQSSVPLDLVVDALENAPGLKFIFLDSCRDNPLGASAASEGEGLARVGTSADFMIAYATQPGAVAYDGDGRNGIFTEAMLSHIHTRGQTLSELMIAVRRDVIAVTGGQQIPWENRSLTRSFQFNEGPRAASEETSLFQIASRIRRPEIMSFYLRRYPQGAHAEDAADFILERSTDPDPDGDEDYGDDLWNLAQRTRQRQLAEFYIELYPDGLHVADAEALLAALPDPSRLGPGRQCELLATHPKDATAVASGTPFAELQRRADEAIEVCREAVDAFPEQPRFKALLARATIAAGRGGDAIRLYREAAGRGDLRALVSLGLLNEIGNGVPKDERRAIDYYEQAAEGGSADGMINLAVALIEGRIVPQDTARAIRLFRRASALGAPEATYNLGALTQRGLTGAPEEAFELFLRSAQEGEVRGYRAAAILLDKGFGVDQDFPRAASLILRGAAEDRGQILEGFRTRDFNWSPETIRAAQSRLKEVGFYSSAIDGVAGENFVDALEQWRKGGFDASVLDG